MENQDLDALANSATIEKKLYHPNIETSFLEGLKNSTPKILDLKGYVDADDELRPIAERLKFTSKYLSEIEPSRIKYFYTGKPKKKGDTYEIFNLLLRNEVEKTLEESYDYILTVYYDAWSILTPVQKVITLDKALCAIDFGDGEEVKLGKTTPDCSEFKTNMRQYGASEVMETSDLITAICRKIADDAKEAKAQAAADKKSKKK